MADCLAVFGIVMLIIAIGQIPAAMIMENLNFLNGQAAFAYQYMQYLWRIRAPFVN
jgi:hypothetical protein